MKRTFSDDYLPPPPEKMELNDSDSLTMIGRDEANLAGLPVTRKHRQDKRTKIERTWKMEGRHGEEREFYRLIKSKSGGVLPGPTADRVLNALSCLTNRQGRTMSTSYSELARLSGLQKSGQNYSLIYRALDRLQDVMIETNSIWLHAQQQYVSEAKLYLIGAQAQVPEPDGEVEIRVAWTNEFYNMIRSWTKPINVQSVNELSSPVARRLYRLSELAFYQEGHFLEDLRILYHAQLGLSKSRTAPSKIKESLETAVNSLEEKGLARIEYVKDDSLRSGEGIYVTPGPQVYDLEVKMDDPRYWAFQIAIRGVQSGQENPVHKCRTLIDGLPISFVKRCVRGYDVRRQTQNDLKTARGPGWLFKALQGSFEFDTYNPNENEPHIGGQQPPVDDDHEPSRPLQSTNSSFARDVYDHIQMSSRVNDRQELQTLAEETMREEAEGDIGHWLSQKEDGPAKEIVEIQYLARAYIEVYGIDSLPEHIRSNAPKDLSQLGF